MLAHRNNSLWVDMSRPIDTFSSFLDNQSLILLLKAACIEKKHQITILNSLVCPNRGRTPGAPPLKLEKIWFFGVRIMIFHTKYPKIFAPPSARYNIFKCIPPLTWNPGSAPANRGSTPYSKALQVFTLKSIITVKPCYLKLKLVVTTVNSKQNMFLLVVALSWIYL